MTAAARSTEAAATIVITTAALVDDVCMYVAVASYILVVFLIFILYGFAVIERFSPFW